MRIKKLNGQSGQGMTEYIIVVALIAIAAIGIYGKYGDVVSNQMAGVSLELSGTDGAVPVASADAAATAGSLIQQGRVIGLDDYTDNGADD